METTRTSVSYCKAAYFAHKQSCCVICADRSPAAPCRCNRLLEPVMLEVKKMRTLSRRGSEMDEGVVMDKTNKYLVSESTQEGDKCSASAGGGGTEGDL